MRDLLLCDNGHPEECIPLARERGLGVELQSFYHPSVLDDPAPALAAHRRLLAGFGGRVSLHGPFGDLVPGSFDPLVRQVAAHRMAQALAVAAELGIHHIVFHHGYVPNTSSPPSWAARSVAFWRELLEAVPAGTHIHLENLLEWGPEVLQEVVQGVGDPRLGVCLDAGHAHALSRTAPAKWVEVLGENLTYVHLHDNRGSRDEHLPLGQGNLPLAELLAALEAYARDALLAIEAEAEASLAWLEANGFLPAASAPLANTPGSGS